jgi:hypothetical protein
MEYKWTDGGRLYRVSMLNLRNIDVQPTLGLMVECTKALDLLVNNMEKAFMSTDQKFKTE